MLRSASMTLEQALLVSARPLHYKLPRIERAMRILRRWVESPCSDREYLLRLHVLSFVYSAYKQKTERLEREKQKYDEALERMYRRHMKNMREQEAARERQARLARRKRVVPLPKVTTTNSRP